MQLLGAWGAYFLYRYFVNTALQPIGGHFTGRIMLAEAVGTAIFAFGWAASVYQSFPRAVSAAVTGIAYMLGIIAASAAAIGLANPALALGVRAWVWGTYVLGPVVGAVIAVNLYGLLFASPESLVASSGVTAAAVVTEVVTIEPANARKSRPARTTKAKSVAKKKTTTRRTTRK
jgi:hypothetical protein